MHFFGYSKDVKGYRLLQPHSHDIIIRRDVKFDENLLACKPNLAGVPSLACEPDSTIVPYSSYSNFLDKFSTPVSDDDNEDENPPLPAHVPPIAPAPILPRWVCSTCEATGDLAGDPRDQCRTCSQFQRASSLLAQVFENHDPENFAEASGNLDWDVAMDEEYHSLMANDTWDIVQKEENFSDVNGSIELSMHQMEVLKDLRQG